MLIAIEDYKKITGKTLDNNEVSKVETLLEVAVSYIENLLGYSLEKKEVTETKEYRKTIYLSYRPVNEIKKVSREDKWRKGKNYIEFPKFRECPCCFKSEEVEITYTAGYEKLPDWLKFEIIGLVDDFINSLDEEAKYTSYKIDDIAYSMRDLSLSKKEKLNNIARMIYGS